MLISIHVPKCAGTSFRLLIDRLYGDGVWHNYGTIFSKESAKAELIPPGTQIIHGHFMADAFDGILPDRRYITWVRHPVERVVSNYYHFLRSPDMRDDCCRQLHERKLNIRQFSDLDWMRDEICRYLTGKAIDEFEFVGVSEEFEKSMRLFCATYGFVGFEDFPRANINPDRKSANYALSDEDFAYIADRNRADLAFYEESVVRLRERIPSPARMPDLESRSA
jgi:sulfotransferase famil protein